MATKDISDYLVCLAYEIHEGYSAYIERQKYDVTPWPYELLSYWTGASEKVCFCAMERALKHGLIEYGVSLRSGWLTEKGKCLLAIKGEN